MRRFFGEENRQKRLYLWASLLFAFVLWLLVHSSRMASQRIRQDRQSQLNSETQIAAMVIEPESSNLNLDEGSFLQSVIDALNHPQRDEDIYYSLTNTQRGDTSYQLFAEYLEVLRQHHKGPVQALLAYTRREARAYQEQMLPESRSRIKGQPRYFHIDGLNVDDEDRLTIRFLERDGILILDSDYMQKTLDLEQHFQLYLTALKKQDVEALSRYVYSDLDDPEIRLMKARETLRFYREEGFRTFRNIQYLDLGADHLAVRFTNSIFQRRPEPGAAPLGSIHELELTRTRQDIRFIDRIPMADLYNLRSVYLNGSSPFDLRRLRSTSRVLEIFSEPHFRSLGLDFNALEIESPGSDEPVTLYIRAIEEDGFYAVLAYPTAQAREDDIRGQFLYLSLTKASPRWTMGDVLYPGLTRAELLRHYPFLDIYDYRVRLGADLGLRLSFDQKEEGGVLSNIEYVHPTWLQVEEKLASVQALPFRP